MDDLLTQCDTLTPDDMPNDDMMLVAQELGVETAVRMILKLGGISLYVPKELEIVKERYLLKHFDGKNAKRLALKLNVTERYVHSVITRNRLSK